MNSPNTPESIVLYTPAIPCFGTAGILALLLPSPAHGKRGKGLPIPSTILFAFTRAREKALHVRCESLWSVCFPRVREKRHGRLYSPVSPACFPRARRNMGKARGATPEKPRFPHMPGTAEWPILFGWGRLSHAGRMMPPPAVLPNRPAPGLGHGTIPKPEAALDGQVSFAFLPVRGYTIAHLWSPNACGGFPISF